MLLWRLLLQLLLRRLRRWLPLLRLLPRLRVAGRRQGSHRRTQPSGRSRAHRLLCLWLESMLFGGCSVGRPVCGSGGRRVGRVQRRRLLGEGAVRHGQQSGARQLRRELLLRVRQLRVVRRLRRQSRRVQCRTERLQRVLIAKRVVNGRRRLLRLAEQRRMKRRALRLSCRTNGGRPTRSVHQNRASLGAGFTLLTGGRACPGRSGRWSC